MVTKGALRLVDLLRATEPDVVILLDGVNDANDNTLGNVDQTADLIVSTLRDDVDQARKRGAKLVIWSTLLPEIEGRPNTAGVDRIPIVNDLIRAYESRTDAVLVDAFAAFEPQKELLIGVDGLHPTVAGYKKLAGLFLDAIAAHFQEPSPPPSPAFFGRPTPIRKTSGTAPTAGRRSAPPSRGLR
jgi:lysophospholipase L1-like esterase